MVADTSTSGCSQAVVLYLCCSGCCIMRSSSTRSVLHVVLGVCLRRARDTAVKLEAGITLESFCNLFSMAELVAHVAAGCLVVSRVLL